MNNGTQLVAAPDWRSDQIYITKAPIWIGNRFGRPCTHCTHSPESITQTTGGGCSHIVLFDITAGDVRLNRCKSVIFPALRNRWSSSSSGVIFNGSIEITRWLLCLTVSSLDPLVVQMMSSVICSNIIVVVLLFLHNYQYRLLPPILRPTAP